LNTTWRVLVGDVREKLAELPSGSVQCCVTSPPYWGLRDYGHAGQIGLESTPEAFVAAMVEVFSDVRRVLADDGVCWLNLGDSYARQGGRTDGVPRHWDGREHDPGGMHAKRAIASDFGAKPKDLVGIPWRVAFALQADGWYLRSDVIWAKSNPMPESVTDRPTKSHEYVFLLTKAERYYYDADAIAEPSLEPRIRTLIGNGKGIDERKAEKSGGCAGGGDQRNARSVWTINTHPYPEAHFATFPEALPERCIKAGSKEGDTVLDPFCGSGTTGAASMRLGRNFVGIELNPVYAELSRKRIGSALPMFSQEVPA
jgi:DNA modification methylase